jgi:DNA-binding NarL/FixJ family response regulator
MTPLRILLVDDHKLFRRGIELLLASHEGFEVVGSAGDGLEAIALARKTEPDLILMDVEMPRCNGLEAVRQIKSEMPHVKVVMLTVSDDSDDLFDAIKSGAQGYLLKDIEPDQLVDMLEGVRHGEAPLSGLMAARILDEFSRAAPVARSVADQESAVLAGDAAPGLTEREIEVLELVVAGRSNTEIAKDLFITTYTVKNHLSNILSKLHLQNRVQLAVYAVRQRLVEEEGEG